MTCGLISRASSVDLAIELARPDRSAACASRRPRWSHAAPVGANGRPLHVVDRRVVDRRPCRRARRPRSPCCRPSCGLPSTARGSCCRRTRSRSRCRRRCRCVPMIASTMSLARHAARRARPRRCTSMFFAFFVSRHCVASTCSTSEVPMPCARHAERAVRAGVRVAADDRHAGQRRALLRPDHVHDALALVEVREIDLGAELLHVRVQRLDLQLARTDRARPRCPRPSRWSACCGRRSRRPSRRARACGRRLAGLRRPAGSSPRGRGGGRCRGAPCRRPRCGRRGCPRACRKACVPCGHAVSAGGFRWKHGIISSTCRRCGSPFAAV